MWTVNRHGGRVSDTWRTLLETEDGVKAWMRYFTAHAKMRQGGVELIGPDGKQLAYSWAPRLRSRW